jgi:hypothetical protein
MRLHATYHLLSALNTSRVLRSLVVLSDEAVVNASRPGAARTAAENTGAPTEPPAASPAATARAKFFAEAELLVSEMAAEAAGRNAQPDAACGTPRVFVVRAPPSHADSPSWAELLTTPLGALGNAAIRTANTDGGSHALPSLGAELTAGSAVAIRAMDDVAAAVMPYMTRAQSVRPVEVGQLRVRTEALALAVLWEAALQGRAGLAFPEGAKH